MKVSFKGSFAAVLVFIVLVAAALVIILPTGSDETVAADIGEYEVTGDVPEPLEYDDLVSAFADINSSASGINFIITIKCDSSYSESFILDNGKNVILRSSDDGIFLLTAAGGKRHGTVVNGSLTLENVILNGNTTGGGIVVSPNGTLTMNEGSVILGCYAVSGGAVYSEGTLTIDGGTILSNATDAKPSFYGGGIYNIGIFTMKNGDIRENISYFGGGVYNGPGAVFIMESGTITGNKASFGTGVNNDGTFTFTDGMISGTSAAYGSCVYNHGTFTMNGGNITGGSATEAAGVCNYNTFDMNGGTISSNSATRGGGGISNYGTITMTAGMITGNSAQGGGGAGILNYRIFNMSGGTISDNTSAGYGGGVSNSGSANTTVFTLTGGLIAGNSAITGGGVCTAYKAQFYMSGNAEISGNSSDRGGGIALWDNSTFTFDSGTITDNTGTYGGGVYSYIGSQINMSGGTISDNTGTYGGGIFSWESTTINMSGGLITNNNSTYGGGVANWANDSTTPVTFIMSGGTISYNTADYGGGMYSNNHAVHNVEVSGGDFSFNTAKYGGGIYNASKLSVIGGSIIGNMATDTLETGSGGGIFTTSFANLIVGDGVVFSGNTAPLLRAENISPDADIDGDSIPDVENYKNIGNVVLNAPVDVNLNAPAYNNYDINYLIDTIYVFIDTDPNGGGTVVVKDSASGNVFGTLNDSGFIYIPITVNSVTLSATPEKNFEFIGFATGGAEIGDINNVQVSNGMTIVAEFISTGLSSPTDPSQKEYYINATADPGAKLYPSGDLEVLSGSNKTFMFLAGPGSEVSAVYVDGVAISSEELASGKYTFTDIKSNHTIHVVSSMPVGDEGKIDEGGGTSIFNPGGPGTGGGGTWAVLNLVCAMIALFAGIIAVIAGRNRFRTDVPDRMARTASTFRILALIIGIVSVILFFLTENLSQPFAATDGWSMPMLILLIAVLALSIVSFRIVDEVTYMSAEESDTITEE